MRHMHLLMKRAEDLCVPSDRDTEKRKTLLHTERLALIHHYVLNCELLKQESSVFLGEITTH